MKIGDTYNIHCFLYDVLHIGTHHFKSKLLCKLGFHNYQLHFRRTKYDYETYWKCYCCNKEERFERSDIK